MDSIKPKPHRKPVFSWVKQIDEAKVQQERRDKLKVKHNPSWRAKMSLDEQRRKLE